MKKKKGDVGGDLEDMERNFDMLVKLHDTNLKKFNQLKIETSKLEDDLRSYSNRSASASGSASGSASASVSASERGIKKQYTDKIKNNIIEKNKLYKTLAANKKNVKRLAGEIKDKRILLRKEYEKNEKP